MGALASGLQSKELELVCPEQPHYGVKLRDCAAEEELCAWERVNQGMRRGERAKVWWR